MVSAVGQKVAETRPTSVEMSKYSQESFTDPIYIGQIDLMWLLKVLDS